MGMHAQRVTDQIAFHAEGPVWWPAWGGLRFVDMLAGRWLTLRDGGAVEATHLPEGAGSIVAATRPRTGGGAVIGVERGFALEAADGSVTLLPPLWPADRQLRMNEGACDPQGRFWCGSMHYEKQAGAASLWRLSTDMQAAPMLPDLTISNGLDWSPDGASAYFIDTPSMRIDLFDYDGESLLNRRPLVDFGDEGLRPDGLTVDAEGCVWVAYSNGAQVRRYRPDGRCDGRIELPTKKVTACTFGGESLQTLFITTSRDGVPDDGIGGSLFAAEVGVTGQPTRCFAG